MFFQAEDGIRDAQESRGLEDVYKRQAYDLSKDIREFSKIKFMGACDSIIFAGGGSKICLLYPSDAADDLLRVDLGGCRIIKKTMIT